MAHFHSSARKADSREHKKVVKKYLHASQYYTGKFCAIDSQLEGQKNLFDAFWLPHLPDALGGRPPRPCATAYVMLGNAMQRAGLLHFPVWEHAN
jgi:hypothetical protein